MVTHLRATERRLPCGSHSVNATQTFIPTWDANIQFPTAGDGRLIGLSYTAMVYLSETATNEGSLVTT